MKRLVLKSGKKGVSFSYLNDSEKNKAFYLDAVQDCMHDHADRFLKESVACLKNSLGSLGFKLTDDSFVETLSANDFDIEYKDSSEFLLTLEDLDSNCHISLPECEIRDQELSRDFYVAWGIKSRSVESLVDDFNVYVDDLLKQFGDDSFLYEYDSDEYSYLDTMISDINADYFVCAKNTVASLLEDIIYIYKDYYNLDPVFDCYLIDDILNEYGIRFDYAGNIIE